VTERTRSLIAAICGCALVFGVCTLWIPAMWPFAAAQFLSGAAFACWAVAALRNPEGVAFHPALLLPLVPVAIGLGQLAFSRTANSWETRRAVMEWATYGLAAFLAYQVCLSRDLRSRSLRWFSLFAAGIAVLGVLQNYTSPGRVFWLFDSGYTEGVFGPFTYHTKFANLAELGVAAALWSATRDRDRRFLFVGAAAVLAASVAAAASRGGAVVIAVEMLVLLALSARSFSPRLALTTVLAAGIGAAAMGWSLLGQRLATEEPLRDIRWAIALSSFDMVKAFWATGCGLGNWPTVYPEFARFDAYMRINQAHSDWLQWLIEGGLPMLAAMLAMTAAALRAARREWWALGFVFVWLHGVADYTMQQTPAFAALQVAFWGAAVAALGNRPQSVTPDPE